ncbi:CDK inhibitor P21 binding protein [Euphorbia peplus]|nr:CDK inhibitor P21 binding protein [Euphorbia peplus]
MVHKSTKQRRRRSRTIRPATFSPFSRSIGHMTKPQKLQKKLHESTPISSKGKNIQSESSEDEEFQGVVQADFAFFDPKPDDFHGVKMLLQGYLDKQEWDLSGFVDLILAQTTVGSVVKLEDDDDGLFSVVSALNLGRYKDHKSIMEIKEFLVNISEDTNVTDDLKLLLHKQAHHVGLLVSQRVVNLPPQLLPPLYDALFDEISWATEDEPTEELRKSFRFKSYLFISRIYKHKNADQKNKQISNNEEEIVYIKPEDEIFHKLCTWSFCFPLRSEHATPHELRKYQQMGLVMAVEADKISKFREELHSSIDES